MISNNNAKPQIVCNKKQKKEKKTVTFREKTEEKHSCHAESNIVYFCEYFMEIFCLHFQLISSGHISFGFHHHHHCAMLLLHSYSYTHHLCFPFVESLFFCRGHLKHLVNGNIDENGPATTTKNNIQQTNGIKVTQTTLANVNNKCDENRIKPKTIFNSI